jgi:hypothetical protein
VEQPQQTTTAPAKAAKPLVVRMDRSRDHATVHGDRLPADVHVNVHFYQNGLPFNAAGILIADHPDIEADPKLQARVARLLEKAAKARAAAPGNDADDPDDEDRDEDDRLDGDEGEGTDNDPEPVNLEAWARGEQEVPWQQVSDAIARRFSRRITGKRDALELLIENHVLSIGAVSKKHRKLLESD